MESSRLSQDQVDEARGPGPGAPPPVLDLTTGGADTEVEAFDPVELLAVAAHELRTPLTTIAGFAKTLRVSRRHMSAADLDHSFVILERQTQRLGAMLDELLDLGRHRHAAPALAPVDLADIISDALEASPPPRHVTVTMAGDPSTSPPIVSAGRSTVSRVVVNLLTNAYRYGGPHVSIASHNGAGGVTLSVEDDGPGVPSALEPAIFAPFVRGDANDAHRDTGLGLGLPLARAIAESYGGELTYESVDPHGARFSLRLPAATSPARESSTSADSAVVAR